MKLLKDILYKVSIKTVYGSTNISIYDIQFDSRKVSANSVFVAIKGSINNGANFINVAVKMGAKAIISQQSVEKKVEGITYVEVENSAKALALMATNFYQNPSENLNLIGVTGTNGKTTVATLLYNLFKASGFKVGLISTVNILVNDKFFKTHHTTPDSLTINFYLNKMIQLGIDYCFMEVSSHGIDQFRTHGLSFKGGIFTNLTHDHLDYHKTFSAYRDAKKSFFDKLPKSAFALINFDDKNANYITQNTLAMIYSYALNSSADYTAQILEKQLSGQLLKISDLEIWVKLIGKFNAYNLTAIYGCARILGLESKEVLKVISNLESVEGRFEFFVSKSKITVIVDYAHTPDALKNILVTINEIRRKDQSLITLFGCGGDRDKTKRPKMGGIAAALSNSVIITSDNPRAEDPKAIIDEIEVGVDSKNLDKVISISDRKQAIKTACRIASAEDIILLSGKGHEKYQEINGEKIVFNDFEIAKECLKQFKK
tara:strand:- start:125854 stop:127317 length:1464 start_codon:yes stop_codon:yes gene_type:complete